MAAKACEASHVCATQPKRIKLSGLNHQGWVA